jgi:hypothetical protein
MQDGALGTPITLKSYYSAHYSYIDVTSMKLEVEKERFLVKLLIECGVLVLVFNLVFFCFSLQAGLATSYLDVHCLSFSFLNVPVDRPF